MIAKTYDAKNVDAKWYAFWEKSGFFSADAASPKKPYCIVIPPPNVTGALHMGHALVNTLQDVLIRWKRMSGFETLWVPGTDHAGISTQTVVERHLMATTGKRRKDFSREEFISRVWKWKEDNENIILSQLRKLGCSCDWSRLRFTMDEGNNRAVRTIFKILFAEGLIYRGDYLVNWDPITQTALADDEVEYEERESFLWHFKYPLKENSEFVQIATTRPETMLGDTAVAVSPKDPRYKHLIGKMVLLPLVNREIPIIADPFVDPSFGTGMVKVTPAHDPNDYQVGLSHKLPFVNIMTPDGKINENGGKFRGMTMAEARQAVVQEMQSLGLVEKIEPHTNRIGVSYRSKAIIEPYISKQWFIRMQGFAEELQNIIHKGEVSLIPKHWESTYFHWIDNLRDWCISRQLWWGHRIPIWYSKKSPEHILCYDGPDLPPEVQASPEEWEQDEDVLDTWFSSALWPFATLGWPEQTPDLTRFYPNSVLVTGHDILFFWVARMIFMGKYVMKQVPFPESFLHGLIYAKSYWRDLQGGGIAYVSPEERLEYEKGKPLPKQVHCKWEKMSKTKGNIIDPLQIIDEYGTDAIRMALCASASQAKEIDLDLRRFEEFKNFTNKIWNGARFVFLNLEEDAHAAQEFSQGFDESLLALEDRWILSTLNQTIHSIQNKLSRYLFDQATLEAYDFFWNKLCSYYLEISKPILFGKVGTSAERKNKQKLLGILLLHAVRLLHPMAPFITEELFQLLKEKLGGQAALPQADPYTQEACKALQAEACIVAPYPQVVRESDLNPSIDQAFALMEKVVYAIRNIRGEMKIPPGTGTNVTIVGNPQDLSYRSLEENQNILRALVKIEELTISSHPPQQLGLTSTALLEGLKIMVPVPAELLQKEQKRLDKEKERLIVTLEKLKMQLANEEFIRNAPPPLVEKQRKLLEQTEREIQEINLTIALDKFSQ